MLEGRSLDPDSDLEEQKKLNSRMLCTCTKTSLNLHFSCSVVVTHLSQMQKPFMNAHNYLSFSCQLLMDMQPTINLAPYKVSEAALYFFW